MSVDNPTVKIFVSHRIDLDSRVVDHPLYYPIRSGAIYDKSFDKSSDKSTMQGDDTGDNISTKNFSYCELTAQYWAWKNVDADYYGFCHYRRYFSFNPPPRQKPDGYAKVVLDFLDEKVLSQIICEPSEIIAKMNGSPLALTTPFNVRNAGLRDVYDQYVSSDYLHRKDIDILLDVIHDISPEFDEAAKEHIRGPITYPCNMFIMKKDLFFRYCTWLFAILAECEKRIDLSNYNVEELRLIGHLGERCLGIFYAYLNKNENVNAVIFQRLLIKNAGMGAQKYGTSAHHKTKQLFWAFFQTRIGTFIWFRLKKIVNSKYVKKILAKMLDYDDRFGIPRGHTIIDELRFPVKKKNALILMPAWGPSAACMYVKQLCDALHNVGYTLHLIIYSPDCTAPVNSFWEYTYTIRPISISYGQTHIFGRDNAIKDTNLIDDWVGDDLLNFIKVLNKNCHFELCMCNYVFFSKIFTCLDSTAKKIIVTHDVFSGRNERLFANGTKTFCFGTVLEEEKKGMDRADYILAIQEKERLFFKSLTDKPVITLPYVPAKKYRNYSFSVPPLKIGYIASANPPNITSIKKYIALLRNEKNIAIFVAGVVSFAIEKKSPNVSLLGVIDDMDDFYSRYDLYINPDTFESGLKIKTVEALSYGCPVVCTKEASVGIEIEKEYHKAESIEALAEIAKECVANPVLLSEMAEESRNVYDRFFALYPTDKILDEIINESC